MNFFRPSVCGYPARPPLSLPPPLYHPPRGRVIGDPWFKEIDCICILLKPYNARITITFEYCNKQLLSHLQRSASHNIVFVFTNTRSTFYRPGDTVPALREVLDRVKKTPPHVNIAFTPDNTFCMDNEAFRFLVALKNGMSSCTI